MAFPDTCRAKEGRPKALVAVPCPWAPSSLSASLGLRKEEDEDDDGGVGYVGTSSLSTCSILSVCPKGAVHNGSGAPESAPPGVLGAVGSGAPLLRDCNPGSGGNFTLSIGGAEGVQREGS